LSGATCPRLPLDDGRVHAVRGVVHAIRGVGDEDVGGQPVGDFAAVAVVEGDVLVLVVGGAHATFSCRATSRWTVEERIVKRMEWGTPRALARRLASSGFTALSVLLRRWPMVPRDTLNLWSQTL